ncbi:hypothetical protein BGZ74_010113 [Mortierella antarctica]|nr:hypothetical protein BGZ74_010113 [Mortierella antarctica]
MAIAVGSSALLGVCVGILYHRHQQDLKELWQQEQIIRDRFQLVAENNLPPFYIDHELDPVAIYEHELPPDVVPAAEPILIQSSSEDVIPPEEDPLMSSPPFTRGLSTPRIPSLNQASESNTATTTPATHETLASVSSSRQDSLSVPIEGFTVQTFGPSSSTTSFTLPTSPEATMVAAPMSPNTPITHEELMTLAQLPPPPSYDVPNRIVDQSPMMEFSSFSFGSPHSSASTTFPERALTPSAPNDYFTQRARSHTFSHPPSAPHHRHVYHRHQHHHSESQVRHQQQEASLPQTPRYSLEFPSHIPHELHLQQYQQARASSFVTSSSSSTAFSTPRVDASSPHMLQSRSFSQPGSGYYHQSSAAASSETLALGGSSRRARQTPAGARGRSSTIGESSKLLIQRMQSLWRKTAGGTLGAMPSSAALAEFRQDVPQGLSQGLGLSLGDENNMPASPSSQQDVEDVVVVVVPEEEDGEVDVASSSASTLSPEEEEEDKVSSHDGDDIEAASASFEDRMHMHMAMPLAVS